MTFLHVFRDDVDLNVVLDFEIWKASGMLAPNKICDEESNAFENWKGLDEDCGIFKGETSNFSECSMLLPNGTVENEEPFARLSPQKSTKKKERLAREQTIKGKHASCVDEPIVTPNQDSVA